MKILQFTNALLPLLFHAAFLSQGNEECRKPEPTAPVTIFETDGPKKGALFTFFAPKAKIKARPTKMVTTKNYSPHFKLSREGNKYTVLISRPITLSSILGKYASGNGFEIELTLTCMDSEYATLTVFHSTVFVKPELTSRLVRKYFFMGKEKFRVFETAEVGEKIGDLIGRIVSERKDFATIAVSFQANPNTPSSETQFTIFENGSIYLNSPLKYTQAAPPLEFNVTAKGEEKSEANVTLMFEVLNVDNNSPYFKYECQGCTDFHYQAEVTPYFLGEIVIINPGPIQALDADGEPLNFEFVGGSPVNFRDFLEINGLHGNLSLRKYPKELKIGLIDAVIRVTSVGNLPQMKTPVSKEAFSIIMIWIIGQKFDFKNRLLSTSAAARPFSDSRSVVGALVFALLASKTL